jgi:hypothetical protein
MFGTFNYIIDKIRIKFYTFHIFGHYPLSYLIVILVYLSVSNKVQNDR